MKQIPFFEKVSRIFDNLFKRFSKFSVEYGVDERVQGWIDVPKPSGD